MKIQSFTAIIYKEADMYIAECPEVGTVDRGETIEQAIYFMSPDIFPLLDKIDRTNYRSLLTK
jgi:hypothetical protein